MAAMVLALLSLPRIAQAQPDAPPADAPAATVLDAGQDRYDRMTVPVMINGRGPYPFVVDTGSNRSVISDALALELGLPAGPAVRIHSVTREDTAQTVVIARLEVGGRVLTNVRAPVFTAFNLGAAGMLGIDALAGQRIVMDFKAVQMTIGPSSRADDDPADIVVRARSRYGQLVLVDSSINEMPLYVIIDTGGQMTIGNLELRRSLARRKNPAVPQSIQVTSVTGDKLSADLAAMPRVRLGGVLVSNMTIAYADMHSFRHFGLDKQPAMFLGMDTLRYFKRVSVDFKARQVRLLLADGE